MLWKFLNFFGSIIVNLTSSIISTKILNSEFQLNMTFQVFSVISLFIIFSIYWWGLSFLYKRKYNVKKDNTLSILLNDRDIENLVGCTIKGNELIFFSPDRMLEGKIFFWTDIKSNLTHYHWLNYIYSNHISTYLKNQTKIYVDFLPPSINKAKLKFKISEFNAVLHIKQKDKDLKIADYNLIYEVELSSEFINGRKIHYFEANFEEIGSGIDRNKYMVYMSVISFCKK